MARGSDYITAARAANKAIWDGINTLQSLQREWAALDYGNTLEEDETGANVGYSKTEVGAVVFATSDAFVTLLNTGHATNMANLL